MMRQAIGLIHGLAEVAEKAIEEIYKGLLGVYDQVIGGCQADRSSLIAHTTG